MEVRFAIDVNLLPHEVHDDRLAPIRAFSRIKHKNVSPLAHTGQCLGGSPRRPQIGSNIRKNIEVEKDERTSK